MTSGLAIRLATDCITGSCMGWSVWQLDLKISSIKDNKTPKMLNLFEQQKALLKRRTKVTLYQQCDKNWFLCYAQQRWHCCSTPMLYQDGDPYKLTFFKQQKALLENRDGELFVNTVIKSGLQDTGHKYSIHRLR